MEEGRVKKISRRKRKRRSISINVDLYEVCLSYIIHCLLFYFMTILTPFFRQICDISLTRGGNPGSIDQKDSSCKRTRMHMHGGGKFVNLRIQ